MTDFALEAEDLSTSAPSAPASGVAETPQAAPEVAPSDAPATDAPGQEPAAPQPRTYTDADLAAERARYQQAVAAAQAQAQQEAATRRAYEQRMFEAQIAQLPREQQDFLRAQRELQEERAQLAQTRESQTRQIQALEPVFREMIVRDLAQEYAYAGVRKEHLARFSDPESMEAYCKLAAEQARTRQATQRQQSGVDQAAAAGTGRGTAAPRSYLQGSLTDLLSQAFR